jgi:hypothetical protein
VIFDDRERIENKMDCKYQFLIGWVNKSEGAGGKETGINSKDDLKKLYASGSKHVACYEYEAPSGYGANVGESMAFRDNFTDKDTVSILTCLYYPETIRLIDSIFWKND